MGVGMQIACLGFTVSAAVEAEAGAQLVRLERFRDGGAARRGDRRRDPVMPRAGAVCQTRASACASMMRTRLPRVSTSASRWNRENIRLTVSSFIPR